MNIKTEADYYTLLFMLTDPDFAQSFQKVTFSQPDFSLEGFYGGTIPVSVEFTDVRIGAFSRKWEEYNFEVRYDKDLEVWLSKKEKQLDRLIGPHRPREEDRGL